MKCTSDPLILRDCVSPEPRKISAWDQWFDPLRDYETTFAFLYRLFGIDSNGTRSESPARSLRPQGDKLVHPRVAASDRD